MYLKVYNVIVLKSVKWIFKRERSEKIKSDLVIKGKYTVFNLPYL
jgi:hypothetical protein